MEILTFPVGIVVGTLSVAVALGDVPRATLLLDGREVCTLSQRGETAAACTVDLGAAPRVHLLELVAAPAGGRAPERVRRWVNRPGSGGAEVRVTERCAEGAPTCTLAIGTVHPDRREPSQLVVTLDGRVLADKPVSSLTLPRAARTGVLAVEAAFADGRRASTVRILSPRGVANETGAALQSVPVEAADGEGAAAPERIGGAEVRALETGDSAAVFVVDPSVPARTSVLQRFLWAETRSVSQRFVTSRPTIAARRLLDLIASPSRAVFVMPRSKGRFPTLEPADRKISRLAALLRGPMLPQKGPLRMADAVAAAGMLAASAPRRRAVVLVLGGGKDESGFTAMQAREYLAEVMVPLIVLRSASPAEDGWPEGIRLETAASLEEGLSTLAAALARQRLAWVDGDLPPGALRAAAEEGFLISGRAAAD